MSQVKTLGEVPKAPHPKPNRDFMATATVSHNSEPLGTRKDTNLDNKVMRNRNDGAVPEREGANRDANYRRHGNCVSNFRRRYSIASNNFPRNPRGHMHMDENNHFNRQYMSRPIVDYEPYVRNENFNLARYENQPYAGCQSNLCAIKQSYSYGRGISSRYYMTDPNHEDGLYNGSEVDLPSRKIYNGRFTGPSNANSETYARSLIEQYGRDSTGSYRRGMSEQCIKTGPIRNDMCSYGRYEPYQTAHTLTYVDQRITSPCQPSIARETTSIHAGISRSNQVSQSQWKKPSININKQSLDRTTVTAQCLDSNKNYRSYGFDKFQHEAYREYKNSSNGGMDSNDEAHALSVLPERPLMHTSCRKLLILDLNGLLADLTTDRHLIRNEDIRIKGKAVFRRPFCSDFINFCFEKFDIGIWSSRLRQNVDALVDFLFGDAKNRLLFCWDQSQCTSTGFMTIENKEKPLVLKELKKLWDKEIPDLPWNNGYYSRANTLLLDDSPYKALGNPPHTAVFPYSYHYTDNDDCSLGKEGDLRVYLEGLALAHNVQEYVLNHPFGQCAITYEDPNWKFYKNIIDKFQQPTRIY